MNKNTIILSESQLHKAIKEGVMSALRNNSSKRVDLSQQFNEIKETIDNALTMLDELKNNYLRNNCISNDTIQDCQILGTYLKKASDTISHIPTDVYCLT